MSAGAQALPAFEVLRFEAVPAEAGVAVLVLAGRFAGGAPGGAPRLLVEHGGRGREVAPARVEATGADLRAVFAVPLDVLGERDAAFALVPARGPLIALPAPTPPAAPDRDGYVRLARVANELRHRLADAEGRAVAAEDRVMAAEARAEQAERDAAAAAREVDDAKERVARAVDEAERVVGEAERRAEEAAAESDHLIAALRAEVEHREAAVRAEAEAAAAQAQRERDAEHEELRARLTAAEERAERFRGDAVDALALVRQLEARLVAAQDEARAAREDRPAARPGSLFAAAREPEPEPEPDPEPGARREPGPAELPTSESPALTATSPTDPVTPLAARRPLRPVPPVADDDEVLEPAQVGARTIRPADTAPRPTLLPRLLALGALALLLVVLVLLVVAAL